MDDKKTLEIVRMLADGIDPITGEVFPAQSPYQNADIVRALHKAAEALNITKRKRSLPARAGKSWEEDESNLLAERFDSGMPIVEIAKVHERTKGAIAARLVRLGKVANRHEALMRVKPKCL
jgi:hypothetical protein